MRKYKLTLIGLIISVVLLFSTIIFDLDLFGKFVGIIESVEKYNIDEIIIPILIFEIFAFFNLASIQSSQKTEIQNAKIHEATMSFSNHALDSFLNQMQLFKATARNTQGFPNDVLLMFDQIIEDAKTQIETLGSITSIDEIIISESVAPQLDTQSSA